MPTAGGKSVSSPETAKRLTIDWSMRRLPTSANEGYGRTVQPLSMLFDQSELSPAARTPRPAMVFFTSQEPNPKLEKRLFDDEELAIASRYFDCVKIYVEDIESKADRERYAKTTPTIIFLDAGAKEVSRISGEASKGDVLRQMAKAANVHFKKSLSSHIDAYKAFIKRFDKVEGKLLDTKEELKGHEEHIVKHPCDRAKNAIKECNEEIETMTADRDKLLAEEKQLLTVALKADPYAKPAKDSAKN